MSASAATSIPSAPAGIRGVREELQPGFPLWLHPEWRLRHPWLVQGTTGRGEERLDLGLFGSVPVAVAQQRWRHLRDAAGMPTAVHARQVHGAVLLWHEPLIAGLVIADAADGHATAAPGLLLTVSVADCVPIFLIAPRQRAVALLHGGWRGLAAGILEGGIDRLAERIGAQAADLELHCGPSICGDCYEVGPEVPAALGYPADGQVQLDLRAVIAIRARAAGVASERITLSTHCTRCGDNAFWSHRAGCVERQLGVLGIRPGV